MSTANDTEEPFDEDQVCDMPEHTLDQSAITHLKEGEQQTVKKMLEMNDDVFASTYENLGYCTIKPFEIITTTETPIVVPTYRKSFHERELINDEVKKM